jgi:hypothetical protein
MALGCFDSPLERFRVQVRVSFVNSIPWGFVSMIAVIAMLAVPFFPSKRGTSLPRGHRSAEKNISAK